MHTEAIKKIQWRMRSYGLMPGHYVGEDKLSLFDKNTAWAQEFLESYNEEAA